jgi:hypothetical protein
VRPALGDDHGTSGQDEQRAQGPAGHGRRFDVGVCSRDSVGFMGISLWATDAPL